MDKKRLIYLGKGLFWSGASIGGGVYATYGRGHFRSNLEDKYKKIHETQQYITKVKNSIDEQKVNSVYDKLNTLKKQPLSPDCKSHLELVVRNIESIKMTYKPDNKEHVAQVLTNVDSFLDRVYKHEAKVGGGFDLFCLTLGGLLCFTAGANAIHRFYNAIRPPKRHDK